MERKSWLDMELRKFPYFFLKIFRGLAIFNFEKSETGQYYILKIKVGTT